MSKRSARDVKSGAASIYTLDLKEAGYLPEAVINWLALMGWAYDDHTEFFQMDDLIEKFTLEKLSPSPAAVNYSKLDHFNGLHIRALPLDDLSQKFTPYFEKAGVKTDMALLGAITPLIQERIRTLDEAVDMAAFFFQQEVKPDAHELVGKNLSAIESANAARQALELIQGLETFELQKTEDALRKRADDLELSAGQFFGILRVALTGQRVSPPLIESMDIIGKELVIRRLEHAIEQLDSL